MGKENNEVYSPNLIQNEAKKSDNFLRGQKKMAFIEDKLFNYINGIKQLTKADQADDLDIVLMLRFIRNAYPQDIQNTITRFKASSMDNRVDFLGFNVDEENPLVLKTKFMTKVLKNIGIKDKTLLDYIALELNHDEYKDNPENELVTIVKSLSTKNRARLNQKLGRPLAPASMAEYLDDPKVKKTMIDYIATHKIVKLSRIFDKAFLITPFLPASLEKLSVRFKKLYRRNDKTHDSEIKQLMSDAWDEFSAVFNSAYITKLNRFLDTDTSYSAHEKNRILSNKTTPMGASFIMNNDTHKTMMRNAFIGFYSTFVFNVDHSTAASLGAGGNKNIADRFTKAAKALAQEKLSPKVTAPEKASEATRLERFQAFVNNIWKTVTGWFRSDAKKETAEILVNDPKVAEKVTKTAATAEQFNQAPAPATTPIASPKRFEEPYAADRAFLTQTR